jgi:hypothetical protein
MLKRFAFLSLPLLIPSILLTAVLSAKQAVEPAQSCCGGPRQVALADGKTEPKKDDGKAAKHGRGFKLPPKEVRDQRHRVSEAKFADIRKAIPVVTAATYDARTLNIVPPVGNQQSCGDCYVWSGCKVCAGAQMAAKVVPQDGKFMIAPSYFLDCQNVGGCGGGDEYQVAQIVNQSGAPSVAQYGGDGVNPGTCKSTTGMTLYTVSSLVMVGSQSGIASTQDIKNYCAAYGYVSVAADAGEGDWDSYTTGTITGTGTSIDHAIGIVGWDDTHDNGDGSKGAWIVQNNWAESWGNPCANAANPNVTVGGYAWIKYGADSIGTEAFVAIAASGPVPPSPTPPTPPTPVPPTPTTGSYLFTPTTSGWVIVPQGSAPALPAMTFLSPLTPTVATPITLTAADIAALKQAATDIGTGTTLPGADVPALIQALQDIQTAAKLPNPVAPQHSMGPMKP